MPQHFWSWLKALLNTKSSTLVVKSSIFLPLSARSFDFCTHLQFKDQIPLPPWASLDVTILSSPSSRQLQPSAVFLHEAIEADALHKHHTLGPQQKEALLNPPGSRIIKSETSPHYSCVNTGVCHRTGRPAMEVGATEKKKVSSPKSHLAGQFKLELGQ